MPEDIHAMESDATTATGGSHRSGDMTAVLFWRWVREAGIGTSTHSLLIFFFFLLLLLLLLLLILHLHPHFNLISTHFHPTTHSYIPYI